MNYRSVADLARCVRENLHRIPVDVDLVVGVPRSGLLAANLVALGLNLKLIDLEGLLEDRPLPPENLRATRHPEITRPRDARHVLVVEDSILSGGTIRRVRNELESLTRHQRITFCAIYGVASASNMVDLVLEEVPAPRAFEWNLMHRELLTQCCVDIDGVLCADPTEAQNDDGALYRQFLSRTPSWIRPSWPIGHLVTARLERYRKETEQWLADNGIRYSQLHMLDFPDAESRRRAGAHAPFKADIYRRMHDTVLFIESDPTQAEQIARLSGKPVLSHSTQQLIEPGVSLARAAYQGRRSASSVLHRARRLLNRISGR